MSWLQPNFEDETFVQQLKQEDETSYRLLSVLALALRIEPLLLRNARLRFAPDAEQGIELETEIWFSTIMHSRNAKACVMRGGIARALVDDFAENQQGFSTAWAFVQEHTSHWDGPDQLEQELRLAARNNDSDALRQGFKRILKTLSETEEGAKKRDLSRWIKGMMPNLITGDQDDEMAHLLFQYTAASLGLPGSWSANRRRDMAAMPQWLVDALPPGNSNMLGIQLRPGLLECLAPAQARHQLEFNLPLPTPVLLDLGGQQQPRWESLWIGRKIRIPRSLKTLSLQTLDGAVYRFSIDVDQSAEEAILTATDPILVYLQEDFEQAQSIANKLKQYGVEVELIQDRFIQDSANVDGARPLLRLWTSSSADFWHNKASDSAQSEQSPEAKGLLIRTDPNIKLPASFASNISFDLADLDTDSEQLAAIVMNWLEKGELRIDDQAQTTTPNEIDALLKELENLETRPRRRLEIGDRLAELGDPRKGVGVTEYEVIEYPPEIQALLDEIADINTEPPRRLEIGNRLAELGDPRPGVGLDENGLPDIDWVEIPAGSFIYGEGETRQTIDLPRFYISRYPVTNAQYQVFIDAGGYDDERWWKNLQKQESELPRWNQANRPRERVDWYEAVAYTRWLSEQLEYDITLPTEQQWEKAARGIDGRLYPWGEEYKAGYANIDETLRNIGPYYLKETTAVGVYLYGESPYGVMDMAGNVWEWCLNKYDNPEQIEPDRSNDIRVLCSCSWFDDSGFARCINRFRDSPRFRSYYCGFRVVCSSPYTDH